MNEVVHSHCLYSTLVLFVSQLLIYYIFVANVEAKPLVVLFRSYFLWTMNVSKPELCSGVLFMDDIEISIKQLKFKLQLFSNNSPTLDSCTGRLP